MTTTDRPPSRIVFAVIGGPITAVLILVTAYTIIGTLARQSESTALVFTQPVTKVRIDLTQGSITLRGGDLTQVTGERIVTRGLQTPSYAERVDGDTLIIESSCIPLGNTWCDVSYVLDVPRSIEVVGSTAIGGIRASDLSGSTDLKSGTSTVSVENISGPLRLESGAGSVDGSALTSGSVQASSGAGSVDLGFTSPPTHVEAGAGAGSVDIEVPRDGTRYRIEYTDGGDTGNTRIAIITDPTAENVLRLESGAGGVSVHYPEA